MGLFDYLRCKYPLPIEGANGLEFQSKDTPAQWMDEYEIREDGTLWHEAYDTEDKSEKNAPPGSLASVCGIYSKVNKRWEQVDFLGEIRFGAKLGNEWLTFSSYFVDGELKELHLAERST